MHTDIRNATFSSSSLGGGAQAMEYTTDLLQPWIDKPELLEKHLVPTNNSWMMILRTAFRLLRSYNRNIKELNERISELRAQNEELEFLSSKDTLTGLKNRRGFEEEFSAELDRINRDQSKGGLLLTITLDNYTAITDVYGKRAVESCLNLAATYLSKTVRKMDTAARLKQDEFILLLSNTFEKDALDRAQQISVGLNSLKLDWFGKTIPVHASLGIKPFGKSDTAQVIFENAETTLSQDPEVTIGASKEIKEKASAKRDERMKDKIYAMSGDETTHTLDKTQGGALVKDILASLSA